jgi:hypothetical protein
VTREEALRAARQGKPPLAWQGYDGPRARCRECGREAVPVVGGVLELLVRHRRPNSETLCNLGSRNPWEAEALARSMEKMRAVMRRKNARRPKKRAEPVGGPIQWTYVPPAEEPEPDLARRPCPKCGLKVTWTNNVAWEHACGEKR